MQMRNTIGPQQSILKSGEFATTAAITRLGQLSKRYSWSVILGFLLLVIVSLGYFTRHFAITMDSNKLFSSSLPWRQPGVKLDGAFPQRNDRIVAGIGAKNTQAPEDAGP